MKPNADTVHVVAGVISEPPDRVLISKRPLQRHLGGLWEFPGGKVAAGEQRIDALVRELREELGLLVDRARPLIRFTYDYPDRCVDLDIWRVTAWHGTARGLEGQELRWVCLDELTALEMPDANRPIIRALNLPELYLITPEIKPQHLAEALDILEACLNAGIRLVQLRSKSADQHELREAVAEIVPLCRTYGAKVLVNSSPEFALSLQTDGVHLSSKRLSACRERPLPPDRLVAASCHNSVELTKAVSIDADFVVLGPVKDSLSHPEVAGIGWKEFERLCKAAKLPVYALGGLAPQDLEEARNRGAQGLAMITGIWNAAEPALAARDCIDRLA